jgi:YcxB-like protein
MSEDTKGQPQELTYSVGDIMALNLMVWPFWISLVAILAVLLIATQVIFGLIDGFSLRATVRAIDWSFTGWMFLIIVAWLITITVVTYCLRRKRGLHGSLRFRLRSDGVAVRNRQMDMVVFWSTIRAINVSRSRLFLLITRRSALIVPKRAFDSDTDFQAFVGTAEKYWRANHSNVPKSVTVE